MPSDKERPPRQTKTIHLDTNTGETVSYYDGTEVVGGQTIGVAEPLIQGKINDEPFTYQPELITRWSLAIMAEDTSIQAVLLRLNQCNLERLEKYLSNPEVVDDEPLGVELIKLREIDEGYTDKPIVCLLFDSEKTTA